VAAHQRGDLITAEQLYRQALRHGVNAQLAANLGALLRQQRRLGEAEQHYRWALEQCAADAQLLANACNLLREVGKAEATLPMLQQGLQRFPGDQGLRIGLALSLHHCNRMQEALVLLDPLLRERPEDLSLWLERGACLAKTERLEEALACFEQACRLVPEHPQAVANRITVLADLARFDQIAAVLGALPAELREHPFVLTAEAGAQHASRAMSEAAALYERLTQLEPDVPDHWLNLAACQRSLKLMVAPLRTLQEGLRRAPHRLDLMQALGSLLLDHGRLREGVPLLETALQDPARRDVQLFIFQFSMAATRALPAAALRERAEEWEQARRLRPAPLWADRMRDPDPHRPLRVGYLSPDYCNHPVGRFIEPVLAGHRRTQVQVVGLSCGRHVDGVTQRLQGHCDEWHDLSFGDDQRVARFMADLQLDLIVDLAGYSSDQRLRLLTAQPAPIQLSYLGYPASTYLRCIQGWIGDPVLFGSQQPQEIGSHETLLPLHRCYLAYRSREAPLPERTAPDERFRFGSFNHSRKLSAACLDRFASVLHAVPDSLLVLKSVSFVEEAEQERIAGLLEQRGVPRARLELLAWEPDGTNHMGLYGRMDVALDTAPYSGTTTTAEALWMGVPVLTVPGRVAVEQQAAAVLAGAQLTSAILADEPALLEAARRLALRGPRSAADRLALRQHVERSPLCDEQGLVEALERLYRGLWQARPLAARC